jgi:molecular chaperone GrpE
MLRIAADFENSKKRSRKEQTDAEARVREQVLKDMLEVVDNLERATSAYVENGSVDGAAVLKGVNLVLRLFQSKLERYNVKPFEAKGQPFDPRVHEAISQLPTDEVPPGSVAAEFQKGYRIGDKLLRPAIVAVATAPAKPKDTEEQG